MHVISLLMHSWLYLELADLELKKSKSGVGNLNIFSNYSRLLSV